MAKRSTSRNKQKTYLVDGGAGFVGSHLVDALVAKGHRVVVLDDFSNGSRENLRHHGKAITVIRGDISWPLPRIKKALKGFRFDGIFHLACWPRSLSLEFPESDLEVNALGTLHMLQLAQAHRCKLVFTSNSGILGNPKYMPMDEKHPDQPTTPYDANKLVGEYYCRIYYRIFGVKVGIVRFAAVYGDRQRTKPGWKPLIAEFVGKVKHNKPAVIEWDGNQTRDFLYVKDAVQGVLKAMARETGDEYYLISTDTEVSVNQIYQTVNKLLGTNIPPIRKPKKPGDLRRMRLSYARAKRVIGYRPRFTLAQGIQNYIRWAEQEAR